MKELLIRSPQEMEALGAEFAKDLKGSEVICLKGDLGSGKTTFVKGLAKGMDIEEGYQVRSPTFTIVNEYPTRRGRLIHIDLYRDKNFDFSEFVGKGVLVIEWKECTEICDICVEINFAEEGRLVKILTKSTP